MCLCEKGSFTWVFSRMSNKTKWLLVPRKMTVLTTIFIVLLSTPVILGEDSYQRSSSGTPYYTAIISLTYKDPKTNATKLDTGEEILGKYSPKSKPETVVGLVTPARDQNNETDGCRQYNIQLPQETWIALVSRGGCPFTEKIRMATVTYNASAIVIYNVKEGPQDVIIMEHSVPTSIAIAISEGDGNRILQLVESNVRVYMNITKGSKQHTTNPQTSISKTSVLFVSISFIVLMIISLAWLVFYYIQRFRYAHAKERLARRLASAAKKAIAKIPQKNVKNGDKELDSDMDQCAVCIEGYKAHDVIRTLPCKHIFHKSCVDPWLLDQRSCPMCKLDILRAYGMHVGGSTDSVHPDGESGTAVGPTVEELEPSSAGDEHPEAEVKVLLLPQHVCFHQGETSAGRQSSLDSSHETNCSSQDEAAPCSDSDSTDLQSVLTDFTGSKLSDRCSNSHRRDSESEYADFQSLIAECSGGEDSSKSASLHRKDSDETDSQSLVVECSGGEDSLKCADRHHKDLEDRRKLSYAGKRSHRRDSTKKKSSDLDCDEHQLLMSECAEDGRAKTKDFAPQV